MGNRVKMPPALEPFFLKDLSLDLLNLKSQISNLKPCFLGVNQLLQLWRRKYPES